MIWGPQQVQAKSELRRGLAAGLNMLKLKKVECRTHW